MYFGQKNGIEVSVITGFDFNTDNPDTDYKSGQQVHVDGTLAQHFPLAGGLAGGGVSAYYSSRSRATAARVRRWAPSTLIPRVARRTA
jgi:hypothetical protein